MKRDSTLLVIRESKQNSQSCHTHWTGKKFKARWYQMLSKKWGKEEADGSVNLYKYLGNSDKSGDVCTKWQVFDSLVYALESACALVHVLIWEPCYKNAHIVAFFITLKKVEAFKYSSTVQWENKLL